MLMQALTARNSRKTEIKNSSENGVMLALLPGFLKNQERLMSV